MKGEYEYDNGINQEDCIDQRFGDRIQEGTEPCVLEWKVAEV